MKIVYIIALLTLNMALWADFIPFGSYRKVCTKMRNKNGILSAHCHVPGKSLTAPMRYSSVSLTNKEWMDITVDAKGRLQLVDAQSISL